MSCGDAAGLQRHERHPFQCNRKDDLFCTLAPTMFRVAGLQEDGHHLCCDEHEEDHRSIRALPTYFVAGVGQKERHLSRDNHKRSLLFDSPNDDMFMALTVWTIFSV